MKPLDGDVKRRRVAAYLFLPLLVCAVGLRLVLPFAGHNYDVDSYEIVAGLYSAGKNIYAETARYNYGPIWFHILGGIRKIAKHYSSDPFAFEWGIAAFLTAVDVLIGLLLLIRLGPIASLLFLLNPVSIWITGYHRQFDNLAILFGFAAVLLLEKKRESPRRTYSAAALLGLSLAIKHVLFLLPVWLFFREDLSRKARLALLLVPMALFALAFIPYVPDGLIGILKHVLTYRSSDNSPLWGLLLPQNMQHNAVVMLCFVFALLLTGYYTRHYDVVTQFAFYLPFLVIFSPAFASQYLAIPVLGIAILQNVRFWPYVIFTTLWLVFIGGDILGLGEQYITMSLLKDAFTWVGDTAQLMSTHLNGYFACEILLLYGAAYAVRDTGSLVIRD